MISLTAALQTLDPGASTSYSAGSQKDRQDGSGYGSDGEFLEALSDAEDQVREHLREVKELQEQVVPGPGPRAAGPRAGPPRPGGGQGSPGRRLRHEHQGAVQRLPQCPAAAIAAAEAAIADAEARIQDAERRIGICEAAADILDPLAERLARALAQLRTVPQDLGEVYELVYEFVRSGGKLPRYGRWIEGART